MLTIRPSRVSALALTGLLTGSLAAAAQTPSAQDPKPGSTTAAPLSAAPTPSATAADARPAAPQATPPDRSQVSDADVERIQRNLKLPPALKLDEQQLRFYVQILAKQQSFSQRFAKGYDWKNGATMGGNPMTHAEFLSLVTPREFYSSGGITATELLQGAIVNWLGQALIKKALSDISNARSEKELQEIRDRIDRELAMLKNKGGT
jgi:hypothetical protein